MKTLLGAALSGVLFSLGLGLGGMTDPDKVVGFLDLTGAWDPSLAFVMAGALGTYALLRRFVLRREKPLAGQAFQTPAHTAIDRRLVGGAILFGVGWGLAGYCPGPAVTSVATGSADALLFVGSMLAGMLGFAAWEKRAAAAAQPAMEPIEDA